MFAWEYQPYDAMPQPAEPRKQASYPLPACLRIRLQSFIQVSKEAFTGIRSYAQLELFFDFP